MDSTWNRTPPPRTGGRRRVLTAVLVLGILALALLAAAARGSLDTPRLVQGIFTQLATDDRARELFRTTPSLQAGFGNEACFLAHVRSGRASFGAPQGFQGPDAAKRFLPFAAKLEIQGSRGAWFAALARHPPFPKLHGIAFGPTRELARRTCMSQYVKQHMLPWLSHTLAEAHRLGREPIAAARLGLDEHDLKALTALPEQPSHLDPASFGCRFLADGLELDLDLGAGRSLALRTAGASPEGDIRAALILPEARP